jgi:hypothetical protein
MSVTARTTTVVLAFQAMARVHADEKAYDRDR